ncbi:MAG: hypothetical protein HXY24_04065 [Rubrivivax sp.]|nr:hypothetical protein [Rubrivivax sp.]
MGRWFECYAAYLRDDPDTVLALARPAVELLEARRSSPFLQPLRLVLGWACAARGDGAEGLALAANALEQYRLQGSRQGFAGLCAMACQTACIAGDVDATGRLLEQAFAAADEVGDQFAASELWRLRAAVARRQGDMDAFQTHLRRARDIAESSGSPLLLARVSRSEAGDLATRAA